MNGWVFNGNEERIMEWVGDTDWIENIGLYRSCEGVWILLCKSSGESLKDIRQKRHQFYIVYSGPTRVYNVWIEGGQELKSRTQY